MASRSSCEKPPEVPTGDPQAAPTQVEKKKKKKVKRVIMPQSHLESLIKIEELEPLPPVDEEWLKGLAALIPNGEQFLADRGITLEKCRELDDMDSVVKAQTDLVAEIQEQLQEKGYVEMEVTDDDDEEEEEGRRVPNGRGRRRFRPGVSKKPRGGINRLNRVLCR